MPTTKDQLNSGARMAGVVVWRCDCSVEYKAVFNSSTRNTAVRCATERCKTRHIISGEVTQLFLQTIPEGPWRKVQLVDMIIDSRATSGS